MNTRFLLGALAVVLLIAIVNTFFLHEATELLRQREITKKELRLEIYQELDSMAWSYDLDANRRYVLKRDDVFRCDVLREEINRHTSGYYNKLKQ